MNKSPHTKAHTFASHTCLCTDQSLQKSVLFTDPRRNSIYFLPFLRCFNFFATHNQPDKTAKHKADKDFNNLTDRTPAGNSGLAKVAVQCSADTFVVNQTFVLRMNICGKNRQLLVAAKR